MRNLVYILLAAAVVAATLYTDEINAATSRLTVRTSRDGRHSHTHEHHVGRVRGSADCSGGMSATFAAPNCSGSVMMAAPAPDCSGGMSTFAAPAYSGGVSIRMRAPVGAARFGAVRVR